MANVFTDETAPTALELATIKFEDELDTALEHVRGAAHMLGLQADTMGGDGSVADAICLMSATLYAAADRVESAHDEVTALQALQAAPVAERDEHTEASDEELGRRARIDAAHMDCLTAISALERLTGMVVQGEIDPAVDVDMDAFVCLSEGIGARLETVAGVLDKLIVRRESAPEA